MIDIDITYWILAILLSLIITIRLYLKAIKWYDNLLAKTPPGENKEWIFCLTKSIGFAINFTNINGKAGTWQLGFFKLKL